MPFDVSYAIIAYQLERMNMSTILETIRGQGVPLDSPNSASQYLGKSEQGIGVLSDAEYIKRIHAITSTTVSVSYTHLTLPTILLV